VKFQLNARSVCFQRASTGAGDLALAIAQIRHAGYFFWARAILALLLERRKQGAALYISGFLGARDI
jgi:hypothetical protein